MMQFLFDGNFYKAIKITGPQHNMLGLFLNKSDGHVIEIIALKSRNAEKINISELDVKEQVFSGIEYVNYEFGVNYKVEKIQYVPSDTPSENVYKELAIEIIKRLISGETFTRI